ncbi:MAG: N-acetylmuramoyl-L-alanine amidase family protein [Alphaproteobacteria bacterium]
MLLNFFRLLLFTLLLATPLPALAQNNEAPPPHNVPFVYNIRFGGSEKATRVVLDMDQPLSWQAQIINSAEEERLEVKLPAMNWKPAPASVVGFGAVRGWRVDPLYAEQGSKQKGWKLILVLEKNSQLQKAFLIKGEKNRSSHRLVLDIASTTSSKNSPTLMAKNQPQPEEKTPPPQPPTVIKNAPPTAPINPPPTPIINTTPPTLVMIDAGHGGKDPGAISTYGFAEKEVTLSVALWVKELLDQQGHYITHLTRDNDYYLSLEERRQKAEQLKAALFISIHADQMANDTTNGASFYTLSDKATDSFSAAYAERENRAGAEAISSPSDDHDIEVAHVLHDLAEQKNREQSLALAALLKGQFAEKKLPLLSNPLRAGRFAVLKSYKTPSVLIEMGYLSNPEDAFLLAKPDYQKKIAEAIVAAINSWNRQPQMASEVRP